MRFEERETAKKRFNAAKQPLGKKIWDVNADNIVISKLVQTRNNFKCLIGYSDNSIRALVLIMPKMSGHVKTFKNKEGDKDKNNKAMSFCIDDENIFEKYKAIWTKIEDLKKYWIKCFTSLWWWINKNQNKNLWR